MTTATSGTTASQLRVPRRRPLFFRHQMSVRMAFVCFNAAGGGGGDNGMEEKSAKTSRTSLSLVSVFRGADHCRLRSEFESIGGVAVASISCIAAME